MKYMLLIFSVSIYLVSGCTFQNKSGQNVSVGPLKTGAWRGVLKPQEIEIPFVFNIERNDDKYTMTLINGEERIPLDDVVIDGDSVHVPLFVFDATIHARIDGDKMSGTWVKNYAVDYAVPFEASFGINQRFILQNQSADVSFDGKWEVDFISEESTDKAIGLFRQNGNRVTGTFLTPTGDYRFLEGVVDGETMKLSCFDGSHAFLFEAHMLADGTISGEFWSGKSWHQLWTAKRNEDFELPDPYAMTYMNEGYDTFEFKFPNTDGDLVELSDDRYRGKIVVVQILGTWCPNCMDETTFYVDWLRKNKDRGVEVIGLAFESKAGAGYAIGRINKMKEKLNVEYEVLIAGTTSAESKAKALPMLSKIMSFPTSIILDKHHKVRKIHTGFSGPGTGDYYEKFVDEFNLLMDKLISE